MQNSNLPSQTLDVAIIGGSFSGLAAALQLARGRRKVVVFDGGQPRNRFATHSQGFLGQDGRPPLEILAAAREQLLAYPTVEWVPTNATQVRNGDHGFEVVADGAQTTVRRVLLTYGVSDHLPPIEGLQALWGISVFHCPYCHAYEFGDRPLGIIATGPASIHQALMLPEWSADVILFTNGLMSPTDDERADRTPGSADRGDVDRPGDRGRGRTARRRVGRRTDRGTGRFARGDANLAERPFA